MKQLFMNTDYWNQYKHYFVRKMDAISYMALNQLYEYVSEVQEQQLLMKGLQKNSFYITQNVLANIESQFIIADLNNACTGATTPDIVSAMRNMIPQNVSKKDRKTLNMMVQQVMAQILILTVTNFGGYTNNRKGVWNQLSIKKH